MSAITRNSKSHYSVFSPQIKTPFLEKQPLPAHLHSLIGSKGEQFSKLYKRGVINAHGDVCEEYIQPLPPLSERELHRLISKLNHPFNWTFAEGKTIRLSCETLLKALADPQAQNHFAGNDENFKYQFLTFHLVGDYLSHFLLTQHKYLTNITATLGHRYPFHEEVLGIRQKYPLCEIRIAVSTELGIKNFHRLMGLILANMYVQQNLEPQFWEREIQSTYQAIAGSLLKCSLEENVTNSFVVYPFAEGQIQFTIYRYENNPRFSSQDLYLDLSFILRNTQQAYVQSYTQNAMQALIHAKLGLTKLVRTVKDPGKNWWFYFNELLKGRNSVGSLTVEEYINTVDKEAVKLEIENWIISNEKNPEAIFALIVNLHFHSQKIYCKEEVKQLTNLYLMQLHAKSALPELEIFLFFLKEQNFSIQLCGSLIQLAGLFAAIHDSKKFEVGARDYDSPILKWHVGLYTVQLPFNLEEAIHQLLLLKTECPEVWNTVEGHIISFFFLCYQPSGNPKVLKKETFEALCLQELETVTRVCLYSESPLICFTGLMLSIISPRLSPKEKYQIAEACFYPLRPLASQPGLQALFHGILGITLPDLNSEQFIFEWIKTLFQYGSCSELRGYTLWQTIADQLETLPFSFECIQSLLRFQPSYATRLLFFLRSKKTFLKNYDLTVQHIIRCKTTLQELENLTEEHYQLIEELGLCLNELLQLSGFVVNGDVCLWFYQHLIKRNAVVSVPYLARSCWKWEKESHDTGKGSVGRLIERDKKIDTLLQTLPRITPKQLYQMTPSYDQNRFGQEDAVQPRGALADLLNLLIKDNFYFSLAIERRRHIALKLIELMCQHKTIRLIHRHRLFCDKIIEASHHLVKGRDQRKLVLLYMRRRYITPKNQIFENFWFRTLKGWLDDEKKVDAAKDLKMISRAYQYGKRWDLASTNDEQIGRNVEELIILREKTIKEWEELKRKPRCSFSELNNLMICLNLSIYRKILSQIEIADFFSYVFLQAPENVRVFSFFLQYLQQPANFVFFNAAQGERILLTFLSVLEVSPFKLSRTEKAVLSLFFSHFFPSLSENKDRRRLLNLCANQNFSPTEFNMQNMFLETLKIWLQEKPEEIELIEKCYCHGQQLGFVDPELFYDICAFSIEAAVKTKGPIKYTWPVALLNTHSHSLLDRRLELLLCHCLETNVLKFEYQLVIIDLIAEKLPSFSKATLALLLRKRLSSIKRNQWLKASAWLETTPTFVEKKEIKEVVIEVIERIRKKRSLDRKELLSMAHLAHKYFDVICQSFGPNFWISCIINLSEYEIEFEPALFSKIEKAKLFEKDPVAMQRLLTYHFICLNSLKDPTVLDWLDCFDFINSIFNEANQPSYRFRSLLCLILGSCSFLSYSFTAPQFNGRDATFLARLEKLEQARKAFIYTYQELQRIKAEESVQKKLWAYRASCNFALVRIYLHKQLVEYHNLGQVILTDFSHVEGPLNLQATFSLLQFLSEQELDETIDLDPLLSKTSGILIEQNYNGFNLEQIALFLIKKPTPLRCNFAIQAWRANYSLNEKKQEPKTIAHNWALLEQIIDPIIARQDRAEMQSVLVAFYDFMNNIQTDFPIEIRYKLYFFILNVFSFAMTQEDSDFLKMVLLDSLEYHNLQLEGYPSLLSTIIKGLTPLSWLNIDYFHEVGEAYLRTLTQIINNKKTPPDFLKEALYLKSRFLQDVRLAAQQNHPHQKTMFAWMYTWNINYFV